MRRVLRHQVLFAIGIVYCWAMPPLAFALFFPIGDFDSPDLRGEVECTTDADCDDSDACTIDECVEGICNHPVIPGCISCESPGLCRPLDVVFLMDTSGSMGDQAGVICSVKDRIPVQLANLGITVHQTFLGISERPGGPFSCLTNDVLTMLSLPVPGDPAGCQFPGGVGENESWGPATAIVAQRFPWRADSVRVIVPISDEGPCNGSFPGGCKDPGEDRAAIDNAIDVAQSNGVIVSPLVSSGADECMKALAAELAEATGGVSLAASSPSVQLIPIISNLLFNACLASDQCDDQNPCTMHDRCVDEICQGTPIPECEFCFADSECDDANACTTDTCMDGNCTHSLVPGCRPCGMSSECDDGNACTDDFCETGRCQRVFNHDTGTLCCNPATGQLTAISDGDDCTQDLCNIVTGMVSHAPVPPNVPCNDGIACTALDTCNAEGECSGVDVESLPCESDEDCPGIPCDEPAGHCACGDLPFLRLVAQPPTRGTGSSCYEIGGELEVWVELGFSTTAVAGGQFLVRFHPGALRFLGADPGATVEPDSPFTMELFENSEPEAGQVFYGVSVGQGEAGGHGPAVMAVLRFQPIASCGSDQLCLVDQNPRHTSITTSEGAIIAHRRECTPTLSLDDGPPVLTCPASVLRSADAGEVSTMVAWSAPSVTDDCDSVELLCTAEHSSGFDISNLIASGGLVTTGTASFHCEAADSCGAVGECAWTVEVQNSNTVEVALQLSPSMARGPLHRCIEFEFFSNCLEPPEIVRQVVEFGFPFNLPGRAHRVRVEVPPGRYECVTARDPLHTLRSVSDISIMGLEYRARFEGDPFFSGNWLVGGNIDGNEIIDILDFGAFVSQYLETLAPDTSCEETDFHGDFNGDRIVDQFDWSFIVHNFLETDKHSCCPEQQIASEPQGIMEISLSDLGLMGLSELSAADLNGDGMLNLEDVEAFAEWERSTRKASPRPINRANE